MKRVIAVSNQFGQTVRQLTINEIREAPVRIDLGNSIPNGLYFLTIKPGKGLYRITKKNSCEQILLGNIGGRNFYLFR